MANYITRPILWLVAIAFLNTIINIHEQPKHTSSLEFNEIESIAEWLIEDVLNFEDAIPESSDTDKHQKAPQPMIDLEDQFAYFQLHAPIFRSVLNINYDCPLTDRGIEIVSPPPDIA